MIKPTFFVFCEGESEDAYVRHLRSKYRVPIEIKTHVAKNKINQKYVERIKNSIPKHKKDKFFLLYDLDVPDMLEKLRSIKGSILLVSNPCIELWFILHTSNHTAEATAIQCVEQLERIFKDYSKGSISDRLLTRLTEGEEEACKKAKKLTLYRNPSTSVFRLIDALKEVQS